MIRSPGDIHTIANTLTDRPSITIHPNGGSVGKTSRASGADIGDIEDQSPARRTDLPDM
jgi:predicted metal-dependent enzyme (double-stranded beta helix superfamily)